MTALDRPAGAVDDRPGRLRGGVAAWRTPGLPYLAVRLHEATRERPRTVDIYTGPASHAPAGIADVAELDISMGLLAAAREWLTTPPEPVWVDEGEQTTLDDFRALAAEEKLTNGWARLDLRRTRSERPDDPRLVHGTHGAYNRGCGCAPCRDAERAYQADRRHARERDRTAA